MTFSIVAVDTENQSLGIAVATGNTCVGSRVPHIKKGCGAIVTQGLTEVSFGIKGLELLEAGYTPQEVLKKILESDDYREYRQIAIVNITGTIAAFTGRKNTDCKGHILGRNYVVLGNLLAKENVIKYMAKAFEKTAGCFAEKLLFSLVAGKEAGGDRRGERSAALVVAPYRTEEKLSLLVNEHSDPVMELKRILIKKLKRAHDSLEP